MSQLADQTAGPLNEREKALLSRLLADPTNYPQALKQWIVAYLEGSEVALPMSAIVGLQDALRGLGDQAAIDAIQTRLTALEQDNLCLAYALVGTPVAANVWTALPFQSIPTVIGTPCFTVGQFAPFAGRLRCQNKGTYAVTARVKFSPAQQATGERGISVTVPSQPDFQATVGGPTLKSQAGWYMVSFEIALNQDDYFALSVTSDVATSIDTPANSASLSAVLIRG